MAAGLVLYRDSAEYGIAVYHQTWSVARQRIARRQSLVLETAKNSHAPDIDAPRFRNPQIDAAENRVCLNHGLAGGRNRATAAKIEIDAAKKCEQIAALKIRRIDPAFPAAENREMTQVAAFRSRYRRVPGRARGPAFHVAHQKTDAENNQYKGPDENADFYVNDVEI